MRCTFYPDVLEPWTEYLEVVPARGHVIERYGTRWLVAVVRYHEWPGIVEREASIWLTLAP
jgi:hypothetical protein